MYHATAQRLVFATLLTLSSLATLAGAQPKEDAPSKPAAQPAKRGLPPVRTDSPRETLVTFMEAMNDYKRGLETRDEWLIGRLDEAIYCLDLSAYEDKVRYFRGKRAAVCLKEVIDRIATVEELEAPIESKRWRLKDTIIMIQEITSGERKGELLFSNQTVHHAPRLYRQVASLPYVKGSGEGAGLRETKVDAGDETGLAPLKTDTPRDTMRTFLRAMNDYRKGVETKDEALKARLIDAVYCLNLDGLGELLRENHGREAAIFLKEVIDRVVVIDYTRIPELGENGEPLLRWRLKDSNISVARIESGDRRGEYLFSEASVANARAFYNKVKALPYLEGSGMGAAYQPPWLESRMPAWARDEVLLFPNWQWIGLFAAIVLGWLVKGLVAWLLSLLAKVVARSKNDWDDQIVSAAQRPVGLLVASGLWWASLYLLRFEGTPLAVLTVMVKIVFSIALIWTFYRLSDVLTRYLGGLASKTEGTLDDHLVPLFERALHTFIVVFGVLVTVQNLGFNVMSVLAGLGLGGLAFALAAQDTCANLIGSLMILIDRPFQVGDWIISGGVEGTVEDIGFRSTRVRTFYNSVISVPNKSLATANVDNMGRRERRRIKTTFDLTYDTSPEKIEAFIEGVKNVVKANEHTAKDAIQVYFSGYGASGLQVGLYCFLQVPDWSTELVARQNMYLEILRLAESLGVGFAFPTQTLHVESFPHKGEVVATKELAREEIVRLAASYGPKGENAKPGGMGIYVPPSRDPDLNVIKRGDSGHNEDGE